MANNLSKTQIDKLGDRLRKGTISEADLRMLDEYRRSFSAAYDFVVSAIRNELGVELTGRPAKSTTSISEKLLRESIRLTQIQDIAGCRLVVAGVLEQEGVLSSLMSLFVNVSVIDRRTSPSHGYRAIHVIVSHNEKLVEVQVRTSLQHVWAELSEKMSDVFDPAIKYGGGQESFRKLLSTWSGVIDTEEKIERILDGTRRRVDELLSRATRSRQEQVELVEQQLNIERQVKEQASRRASNLRSMRKAIDNLAKLKPDGDPNAVSN